MIRDSSELCFRKSTERVGHYWIIGQAFVEGIMFGEFLGAKNGN